MSKLALMSLPLFVVACVHEQPVPGGMQAIAGFEGDPGYGLPEGGALWHSHARLLGMPDQTWLSLYQYTSPLAATAPFPVIADNGSGIYGDCVDERTAVTWPFARIQQANFLTLTNPTIDGPGFDGKLTLVENRYPDPSPSQGITLSYGTPIPPGIIGFNQNGTTPQESTPGGKYDVDIGEGSPMSYTIPDAYTPPLGIGGSSATIKLAANTALDLSWTPPANHYNGPDYAPDTQFSFLLFADPTAVNPLQFICFDDRVGHQTVPAAVVNALPASGLIVHANYTMSMQARTLPSGERRRFDLLGTYINIGLYKVQ